MIAKAIHAAIRLVGDDNVSLGSDFDGSVDAPDTLGKMLGAEKFEELRRTRGMQHDGLVLPEEVAETYVHLAKQHRSAWTFEIDLRSFSDLPWWNH